MRLRLDPEFKNFFGPLDEDTRMALEASLQAEGCRDALVVWPQPDGDPILVDGHNRHEICERLGIDYRVVDCPATVADRSDAMAWIMENQRARRNIEPHRIAYLRGQLYLNEKRAHGGQGGNRFTVQSDHRDHSVEAQGKTAERLAEKLKASAPTIRRNAEFARQVNAIAAKHGQAAKADILAGRKKVSDYLPHPKPGLPVQEVNSATSAPEPKNEALADELDIPAESTPASSADESGIPPVADEPAPAAEPSREAPRRMTDSECVQWMAKNLTFHGDSGLRPGPVHIADAATDNLVDPEAVRRYDNSSMFHLCQTEYHIALFPSALERDAPDAERRELFKKRMTRLVDALQTIVATL